MTAILADPGTVVGLLFVAFLLGLVVGASAMETIYRPRKVKR